MMRSSVVACLVVLSTTGLSGLFWPQGLGRGEPSPGAWPGPDATSLEQLAERLAACATPDRCTHLVYVHSPDMPLSQRGIADIVRATRSLGVPVSLLPASSLFESAFEPTLDALRMALVEAGATVHFPAVVLMNEGTPVGNALVGYKPAEVYESILGRRLAKLGPDAPTFPTAPVVADAPTRDVELLANYPLSGRPGAFFRRTPGTRYISYDLRGVVYLHHLESDESFSAPGRLDFVPSPDGAFFVTPGPANSGLAFYGARDVFRLGAQGRARSLSPMFVDVTLRDQYPSIGILERRPDARRVYRVLTAWYEGAQYRDFEMDFDPDGEITDIRPISIKTVACQGMALSLPILSKDGREMSARDEGTGTTKVFRLGPDGACEQVFDSGMQATKATFSSDGALLAFGSRDGARTGLGDARPAVYVVDRRTHETTRIPDSTSPSLTIPEFVGPDSLLFLVAGARRNDPSVLRLVCCVR